MLRWVSGTVAAIVLSGFTLLLLTGKYREEGPTIASVSATHGLHQGDLYVIAGWLVAMLAVAYLVLLPHGKRPPGPRAERGSPGRPRPAASQLSQQGQHQVRARCFVSICLGKSSPGTRDPR